MWQAFVNHLELADIVFSTYCVLRKKVLQSTLRLGRAFQLSRVCLRAAETSTHFRGSTLGCVGCKVQPPLPTCTAGSDTNFTQCAGITLQVKCFQVVGSWPALRWWYIRLY